MQYGHGIETAGIVAGAIILFFGGRLALAAWRQAGSGIVVRTALFALLVLPAGFALVVPRLDALWLSRAAAEAVGRYRPPRDAPVVVVGYSEPSLVFLLGTRTRSLSPDAAAQYLTARRGAAALVSGATEAAFREALKERGWEPRRIDGVGGINYSNGKPTTLTLYTGVPG
jgi:hypothetical protein